MPRCRSSSSTNRCRALSCMVAAISMGGSANSMDGRDSGDQKGDSREGGFSYMAAASDVDACPRSIASGHVRTEPAMHSKTLKFGKGFRVAFEVRKAQAAEMVIAPGGSEGGADNRHRGADQWLFVVSGSGVASVEGRRVPLKAGTLLVIEKGERHEVRNTGR